MGYICSKDPNHVSDDPDYCSICGAKIAGAPTDAGPAATPTPAGTDACPDCGTPRSGSAVFCEVCRYNFDTRQSYGAIPSTPTMPSTAPSVAAVTPDPFPSSPPDPAPVEAAQIAPIMVGDQLATQYDAIVKVDPTLYTDPDPAMPCPTDLTERVFPLDFAENLIGRRSASRGSFPEIGLSDPGVSHRHAKILIEATGPVLLELGSTNGTQLNGVAVEAGVKTPLAVGDSVTLGCWTRIEIRER